MARGALRVGVNLIAAMIVFSGLIPGIRIEGGDLGSLVFAAAPFALVNAIVQPLIWVLSCPLLPLSLGGAITLIDLLLIYVIVAITGILPLDARLTVDSFFAALIGALIIAAASVALEFFLQRDNRPRIVPREIPDAAGAIQAQKARLDQEFDSLISGPPPADPPGPFPPPPPPPPSNDPPPGFPR